MGAGRWNGADTRVDVVAALADFVGDARFVQGVIVIAAAVVRLSIQIILIESNLLRPRRNRDPLRRTNGGISISIDDGGAGIAAGNFKRTPAMAHDAAVFARQQCWPRPPCQRVRSHGQRGWCYTPWRFRFGRRATTIVDCAVVEVCGMQQLAEYDAAAPLASRSCCIRFGHNATLNRSISPHSCGPRTVIVRIGVV
jgi:hypothetical protein